MLPIKKLASALALYATLATPALALEYPIGTPQQRAGMEIAAVYLQPIEMEPEGMMRKATESDIHIEADIHALANNPNGFEEGAWMPYLLVRYEVSKIGGDYKVAGDFMPMVANDGPHYGENIKLAGPGKYKVKYTILPPSENQAGAFRPPHRPRHRCSPVVQAIRSRVRIHLRRHRQKRRLLIMRLAKLTAALVAAGLALPAFAA